MDYDKTELIQMATSDSTGTPFICYQNGLKKRRVNAEIIYYSDRVAGFTVTADTLEEFNRKYRIVVDSVKVADLNGNDIMRHDLLPELK